MLQSALKQDTLRAEDRRADHRERTVSLSREVVRIDRSLQGIAMRVAVPVRAYRGVALALLPDARGGLSYRLDLLHADDELSVTLDQAPDDRDILADWRLWSRFFRLPALVERETGLIEAADPRLGGVVLGAAAAARRASRGRLRRRPMFLKRRKSGLAALAAITHAGEAELIARR